MKKYYILTGYNKTKNKMYTQILDDIEFAYDVIKYYSEKELLARYSNPRDLDFDVQTCRNHRSAVIIEAATASWSICLTHK